MEAHGRFWKLLRGFPPEKELYCTASNRFTSVRHARSCQDNYDGLWIIGTNGIIIGLLLTFGDTNCD